MIGIITPGNKKYTPYIQNYLDIFDSQKIAYKVMSWDKKNLNEDGIDMRFDCPINDGNRKKMFLNYIRFILKCKRFIKENQINKLIVLTVAPAFFMGAGYLRRFKNNFILDVRDDSPFIRRFPNYYKKICKLAKTVVVSSSAFIPDTGREAVLCHNIELGQISYQKNIIAENTFAMPVRIVFAGIMIEPDINLQIIDALKRDERFVLYYIGKPNSGKDRIEEYVREKGIESVKFEGTYDRNEIYEIYRRKADLVNIFRENTVVNKNAIPNKLYDSVLAGVPVVVFDHNKAIVNIVTGYNLGLVIPEDIANIGETIIAAFERFDFSSYYEGRIRFINNVVEDMDQYKIKVLELCR